ncbi:MAG TPA: type II secretion system protein M [Gammaproteobacteria bacterium]|nr:type II secretion system protein M [Gammaproteobacteria bacterium]
MKDWFLGLEVRERRLVAAAAAVLLVLLLYLVIWEPVASRYQALQQSVAQQKRTLAWMQQAARQVQALRASAGPAGRGLAGRSLMAVVDQSMRAGGLGDSIKRIEPDGSRGVKVWLENVPFDPMILWLGKLTRSYHVETSIITLEPTGNGRVNARLTLLAPTP